MNEEKKTEAINNLINTIELEKAKGQVGNQDLISKLSTKLEAIQNGTHKSKFKKRK